MLSLYSSQAVADFCHTTYDQSWGFIVKLFHLLACNYDIYLLKIPKNRNGVTHKLIKICFYMSLNFVWTGNFSSITTCFAKKIIVIIYNIVWFKHVYFLTNVMNRVINHKFKQWYSNIWHYQNKTTWHTHSLFNDLSISYPLDFYSHLPTKIDLYSYQNY